MLNKLMSSLGLQGIQVDTRIHNSQLQAGQVLNGEVIFTGASSKKHINGIYLKLMTTAEVESNDSEYNTHLTIAEWHISGAFELQANQTHTFPFSIQLPFETQLTVWLVAAIKPVFGYTYSFRCRLGARCHR